MKKIHLFLFAMTALLFLSNTSLLCAAEEDNYKYKRLMYNDVITITELLTPSLTMTIPDTLETIPVVYVDITGDNTYSQIINLSLPASMKSIEAYGWRNIMTVSDKNFLERFPNLQKIKVSENNPYYMTDGQALYSKDGTILYGVCPGINSFTINEKVKKINPGALNGLSKLESIIVAHQNKYYKIIRGSLCSKSGKTLYLYPQMKTGKKYTVPSSVTTIKNAAFESQQYLTEVNTANVKTIEDAAFSNCLRLKKVKTGKKLQSIGYLCFFSSKKLSSISLNEGLKKIIGSAFHDPSIKTLTIPSTVSLITDTNDYPTLPFSQLKTLIIKTKLLKEMHGDSLSGVKYELSLRKKPLIKYARKDTFYYGFLKNQHKTRVKELKL